MGYHHFYVAMLLHLKDQLQDMAARLVLDMQASGHQMQESCHVTRGGGGDQIAALHRRMKYPNHISPDKIYCSHIGPHNGSYRSGLRGGYSVS